MLIGVGAPQKWSNEAEKIASDGKKSVSFRESRQRGPEKNDRQSKFHAK